MSNIAVLPQLPAHTFEAFSRRRTAAGLQVSLYALKLDRVPVDFFADPDGRWTFDALVDAAGFSPNDGVAVGALKYPFNGHPDGAAVVTLESETRPYLAIIECPIAYDYVEAIEELRISAA